MPKLSDLSDRNSNRLRQFDIHMMDPNEESDPQVREAILALQVMQENHELVFFRIAQSLFVGLTEDDLI